MTLRGMGKNQRAFERLMTIETDECIIWPHLLAANGYAVIWTGERTVGGHVVALERRVPRPSPRHQASHMPAVCHNRACINYRHLRWATCAENLADRELDGTAPRGEANPYAKLTDVIVREMRERYLSGETFTSIAQSFGVAITTASRIAQRQAWVHVA